MGGKELIMEKVDFLFRENQFYLNSKDLDSSQRSNKISR